MWGLKKFANENLTKKIYNTLIDNQVASNYKNRPKGTDQSFLTDHVYYLIESDSIIHDSYLCTMYSKSLPWPTKREGNCFVGSTGSCNSSATDFYKCPLSCRPSNHKDWIFC